MTRDELIERHMPIVRRIVGMFQRGGLPPQIEAADLEQEGYLALLKVVDSRRPPKHITSEQAVARRCRDAMVVFIQSENRHWVDRTDWSDLFDEKGAARF